MKVLMHNIVAILVAMSVVVPTPTLADVVHEQGVLWEDTDGRCLKGEPEISDGSQNKGFLKNEVVAQRRVTWPGGHVDCQQEWPQPMNKLAEKSILWKWIPSNNDWAVCISYSWRYNDKSTHRMYRTKDYGSTIPCGSGYYSVTGGGYIWREETIKTDDNKETHWHGWWIYSGYHAFPAS